MMLDKNKGFSLIELMVVLVIIGIISAWGISTFERYSKKTKLQTAKSALLENANYLENFYSKYYRYDQASDESGCSWPALPKTETPDFDIGFGDEKSPRCREEQYIIYARAKARHSSERRYLRMDENKNILLCSPPDTVDTASEIDARETLCDIF